MSKTFPATTFILALLLSAVAGTLLVRNAGANFGPTSTRASIVHVYIRSDGNIEPSTAPIRRVGDDYTFTGDILNSTLEVRRDNAMIDGAGFALQGNYEYEGITLIGNNVTIKNIRLQYFFGGIGIASNHNIISGNTFTNKEHGISVDGGAFNTIINNNFTNVRCGVSLRSSNNNVSYNHFRNGTSDVLISDGMYNTVSKNIMSMGINGVNILSVTKGSAENTIVSNNITGKSESGIKLTVTWGNNITGNFLGDNRIGFYIDNNLSNLVNKTVTANTFSQNDLVNNGKSVYPIDAPSPRNDLDEHKMPISIYGNYWSDYKGADNGGDGIGDTPYYTADLRYADRYPLMSPTFIRNIVVTPPYQELLNPDLPSEIVLDTVVFCGLIISVVIGLVIYFRKRNVGRHQ